MMKRFTLTFMFLFSVFALSSDLPTVNDPLFSQQWALHNDGTQIVVIHKDSYHSVEQKGVLGADIGWLEARAVVLQKAKAPVVVAVLDSGLDINHAEFKGRIADGGYDFLDATEKVSDPSYGHGTETSGVIAANANDMLGVAGVAPDSVKILPLRVLASGDAYKNFSYNSKLISDYTADAIRYAIAHHANVINLSVGWPKLADTQNVRDALSDAYNAGVLVVAASGNDRKDSNPYPCAYEHVICVGAVSNNGQLARYSNFGGNNDLLAPGDAILTTFPTDLNPVVYRVQGYEMASGTSIATPHVSALAATLKSMYPKMSMSEWRARLFLSGGPLPSENAALFGLINFSRAMNAQPQTVYYPHFKLIENLPIDESTLKVSSSVTIEALWQKASQVKAQVYVNGKLAGDAALAEIKPGGLINLPWSYQLNSLEQSAILNIKVVVSDSHSVAKTFSVDALAVRKIESLKNDQVVTIPNVKPDYWLSQVNETYHSVLSQVATYGVENELPKYVRILNPVPGNSAPPIAEFFDPSRASELRAQAVTLNGLQCLFSIIRVDVNLDGNMDWVVIGRAVTDDKRYFQMRFYDSELRPLFGSDANSIWQMQMAGATGGMVDSDICDPPAPPPAPPHSHPPRSFTAPGSWLRYNDHLIPSFVDVGALPQADNYTSQEREYFLASRHLYYLQPDEARLPNDKKAATTQNLIPRAFDGKAFRKANKDFSIQNVISASDADMKAGRIRLLTQRGTSVYAEIQVLDVQSAQSAATVEKQPDWISPATTGLSVDMLSPDRRGETKGFLTIADNARGTFSWMSSVGKFLSFTNFAFQRDSNPIVDPPLLGAFDFANIGRIWFLESQFDLVAFKQAKGSTVALSPQSVIAIDRDSSFLDTDFSYQFTPVIVGEDQKPLPGIYEDLSIVRGHILSIVTYNTDTDRLEKTARYTLAVPNNCAQMPPVQTGPSLSTFEIPMFCQTGGALEFRLVHP